MCNISDPLRQSFYELKIKHQVLIGVLCIILLSIFLVLFMVLLSIFLLNNANYKDIINGLDNREFDQLSLFSIGTENAYMHINELIRSYLTEVVFFKKNLLLKPDLAKMPLSFKESGAYDNFIQHYDIYNSSPNTNHSYGKMVYFSPQNQSSTIINNPDQDLNIMKILARQIVNLHYVNVFDNISNNSAEKNAFFRKIIFVNFNLNRVYIYPAENKSYINTTVDLTHFKDFIITKNIEMKKIIEISNKNVKTNENFKHNETSFKNLPIFIERDIFLNFFEDKQYNLTIMSCLNVYDDENKYDIENFNETVCAFSSTTTTETVFDALTQDAPAANFIISDYFYPYKLYTIFQCQYILYQFNYENYDEIKNVEYLSDCFNKTSTPRDVDFYLTQEQSEYSQIFKSLELFDYKSLELSNANDSLALTNIIEDKETIFFFSKLNIFNQTIATRVRINNKIYKIKKTISPLISYQTFNYYYPVTNIYLNIIFKNEEQFNNFKQIVYSNSVSNLILSLIGSLFIFIVVLLYIIFELIMVMTIIDKPIVLITKAVNSISEKDQFNEIKLSLEKYLYDTNNDEVIDEFIDLITIILDMIEGNMNLKQEMTFTQLYKLKIEEENFNKDFEHVKINNLVVLEDVITEQVEKKNYFNDILKINIDKEIEKDSMVKNCLTFRNLYEKLKYSSKRSKFNNLEIDSIKLKEKNIELKYMKFPFKKKVDRRNSFKKSTFKVSSSDYSSGNSSKIIHTSSSEDEDEEEVDKFTDIENRQKKRIRRMMSITDEYILNKLKRKNHPLYLPYQLTENNHLGK